MPPLDSAAVFLLSRRLRLRFFSALVQASALLPRQLTWNSRFRISQLPRNLRSFIPASLIQKFSYNILCCGNWTYKDACMWGMSNCCLKKSPWGILATGSSSSVFKAAQLYKNRLQFSHLQPLLRKTETACGLSLSFLAYLCNL